MKRGVNMCKIEENVISGIPDFFYPADYVFPLSSSWGETKEMEKVRDEVDFDIVLEGGGINPETGFTRRVELTKPWFDTKYKNINLPDWDYFVAGAQNQTKLLQSSQTVKEKTKFPFWMILCGICLVIIIIFKIYYR